LDYFSRDIRFNNKLSNPKVSAFGAEKRFSFPSKCQLLTLSISSVIIVIHLAAKVRAPAANTYSPKTYWKNDARESIFKNTGTAIFGKDKSSILN